MIAKGVMGGTPSILTFTFFWSAVHIKTVLGHCATYSVLVLLAPGSPLNTTITFDPLFDVDLSLSSSSVRERLIQWSSAGLSSRSKPATDTYAANELIIATNADIAVNELKRGTPARRDKK